jgi:dienelactone hydrolase
MHKELSETVFEDRLVTLPGDILAYADLKADSPIDIILLHEHLGLHNYVRVIGQALTNNLYSLIQPNLFDEP